MDKNSFIQDSDHTISARDLTAYSQKDWWIYSELMQTNETEESAHSHFSLGKTLAKKVLTFLPLTIKPHSCLTLQFVTVQSPYMHLFTMPHEQLVGQNINRLTLFSVYSKTVKFLRTVSTLRPLKTSSLWRKNKEVTLKWVITTKQQQQ